MKNKPQSPIPAITFSLPSQIEDMTIGQLMNQPGTEINYANNVFTARKKTEEGTALFQFTQAPSGRQSMKLTTSPSLEQKSDYIEDIKQMKAGGMKQKDIAYELGISPAYVSQLLKKE